MIKKNSGLIKSAGLIFLLLTLFVIDDVLIYQLLKNIYGWEIDLIYFGPGAALILLLNLGLVLAVLKIMRKRPTTGQPGMIGKKGVVLKTQDAESRVLVQGEIWRSESGEELKTGDQVVVHAVEGLCLHVRKY